MSTDLVPLEILPGVEPISDRPGTTTRHYTESNRIRFVDGYPEKIGGWETLTFDSDNALIGACRSVFSYILNSAVRQLLGTSSRLYGLFGTALTNITPLDTTTIAIADSLDTFYGTLANDPITTVDGSTTLTITDASHKFLAGDTVTLSGSSAVNGVPAVEINTPLFVRSIADDSYTVIINTPATSAGSGGGASVVRASGIITATDTAHGQSDGDRVKITGAATTGGITDAQINLEFIIRNVQTNTFDISTSGTATSAVSGGGGASTEYQQQIDPGLANTISGQGYGLGLYGIGLYGVSKVSQSTTPARLWSHARFGNLTISAHNDQSDVYQWGGVRAAAPVKVANSPPANYVFVSNNICVVLGYDVAAAEENDSAISWCDQGGLTNWTTGQSGSDVIEGAGKFITHASARGENLLFTGSQTYIFRYIGGQFIWQIAQLDAGVGIISQNARASASGVVFWMDNGNFFMWRGAGAEVIPSNSSTESTILRYVFDDINFSQKEKICAWYNKDFREIWWHYPSADSNEPDRVARVNIDTFTWAYDELGRTAAEYPSILGQNPILCDTSNFLNLHENGLNDDGNGMSWMLRTNQIYGGTDTTHLSAFVPDQTLTGEINVNIKTKNYPSSSRIFSNDYVVTPTTERVSTDLAGRYWQFTLSGSDVGQQLKLGQWHQEVKRSSPK